ncbi:MAG: 30S ribosome-binding factor RbfA [Oscillospiraceae bacterium]|nr:30S ribosome-binding factor RbfA [Oscillospiraceae bacterium]
MSQNRIGRINEEMQRELSALIRSLKDPRVQESMISITSVDTSGDLRYAKVYVSVLEQEHGREVLKGLKSAGGFLRRELSSRMQLRYTPELLFVLDDSISKGAEMFALLNSLHIEKDGEDDA